MFVKPENLENELGYDYNYPNDNLNNPGAEGMDEGNGQADEYLSAPDTGNVPVESKLSMEEQKILNEANSKKQSDKNKAKDTVTNDDQGDKKRKDFLNVCLERKKTRNSNAYLQLIILIFSYRYYLPVRYYGKNDNWPIPLRELGIGNLSVEKLHQKS